MLDAQEIQSELNGFFDASNASEQAELIAQFRDKSKWPLLLGQLTTAEIGELEAMAAKAKASKLAEEERQLTDKLKEKAALLGINVNRVLELEIARAEPQNKRAQILAALDEQCLIALKDIWANMSPDGLFGGSQKEMAARYNWTTQQIYKVFYKLASTGALCKTDNYGGLLPRSVYRVAVLPA
ncbi:MAG: hypothetical protein ACRCZA_00125 [Shewanella sp.]|uniref:hypothetical protein n=1 Tax=Shewanella sp. TaxID=50422 RepID=UPI003F40A662